MRTNVHTKSMEIRGIEWDHGNWPKCGKHGATKDEIEHVLEHTTFRIRDPYPDEERYNTAHPAITGRHIFVAYTYREREDGVYMRPISARPMHEKEVKRYEQIKQAMAKAQNP